MPSNIYYNFLPIGFPIMSGGSTSTSATYTFPSSNVYTNASYANYEHVWESPSDPYSDVKKIAIKQNNAFVNLSSFFNENLHVHNLCFMTTEEVYCNKDDDISHLEISLSGDNKRGDYNLNTCLVNLLMDKAYPQVSNGAEMFASIKERNFNWIIMSPSMLRPYLQNDEHANVIEEELEKYGLMLIDDVPTSMPCQNTKIFVSNSSHTDLNWVLAGHSAECVFEWVRPLVIRKSTPKCMFNLALKNKSNLLYYHEQKHGRDYYGYRND